MAREKKSNLENKKSTLYKELKKCISDEMLLFDVSSSTDKVLKYFEIALNIQDTNKDTQKVFEHIVSNVEQVFLLLENSPTDIDRVEIFYLLVKALYNLKEGFKEERKKQLDEHMRKIKGTANGSIAWLTKPIALMQEVEQYRKEHNVTKQYIMPYEKMEARRNGKK